LFCVAYPRSRSLKPKLESSEFDGGTPKKHVVKTGSIIHAVPVLFLRRMWVRSEQGVFVVVVDLSGGIPIVFTWFGRDFRLACFGVFFRRVDAYCVVARW
jgi:hypothetical protein